MTKKYAILFKNTIKLEDAVPNKRYKFTLNPDWKPDYTDSKISPINQFNRYIKRLLDDLTHASFSFCIELSPVGRFHIHGWLVMLDVKQFYTWDIHQISGINGLLGVDDPDFQGKMTWAEYCYKQQPVIGVGWLALVHDNLAPLQPLIKLEPTKNDQLEKYDVQDEPTTPPNTPIMTYSKDYKESKIIEDDSPHWGKDKHDTIECNTNDEIEDSDILEYSEESEEDETIDC